MKGLVLLVVAVLIALSLAAPPPLRIGEGDIMGKPVRLIRRAAISKDEGKDLEGSESAYAAYPYYYPYYGYHYPYVVYGR